LTRLPSVQVTYTVSQKRDPDIIDSNFKKDLTNFDDFWHKYS